VPAARAAGVKRGRVSRRGFTLATPRLCRALLRVKPSAKRIVSPTRRSSAVVEKETHAVYGDECLARRRQGTLRDGIRGLPPASPVGTARSDSLLLQVVVIDAVLGAS